MLHVVIKLIKILMISSHEQYFDLQNSYFEENDLIQKWKVSFIKAGTIVEFDKLLNFIICL